MLQNLGQIRCMHAAQWLNAAIVNRLIDLWIVITVWRYFTLRHDGRRGVKSWLVWFMQNRFMKNWFMKNPHR